MNEENKIIGEQPVVTEVQTAGADVDKGTEMLAGSPIGKFKDAQKLLDAYNELQSEFTRKCQKLSDAEKKLKDLTIDDNSRQNQNSTDVEFALKDGVAEFLQAHQLASGMMEDIANELVNDENLRIRIGENARETIIKEYSKMKIPYLNN